MPAKLDAAPVEPLPRALVREMHLYQTLCDQGEPAARARTGGTLLPVYGAYEAANNTTSGRRGVWAGKKPVGKYSW